MTTLVKICGLTDAAGVQAAVDGGADAVGFVFAESVRRIAPRQAQAIAAAVPEGVLRVAVMLHPGDAEWREVREVFAPDVLQTDAADFAHLDVPDGIRRWPVVREGDDTEVLPAEFLYEGRSSGQGEPVDWQQAARLAARGRMILAGGLSEDNVTDAIARVAPWGVDVSSAVEAEPGRKDPQRIRAFIAAVRAVA